MISRFGQAVTGPLFEGQYEPLAADSDELLRRKTGFTSEKSRPKVRAGVFDRLEMLSKAERITVISVFLITIVFLAWILGLLAIKIKAFALAYRVRLSGTGFFFVIRQLMKGEPATLFMVIMISAAAAFILSGYLLKLLSRVPGDMRKRAKVSSDSCDWFNYDIQDVVNTFEITPLSAPEGTPLCTYKGKLFCMPENPTQEQFKNRNICIIGGSGFGKSYGGVEPILMTKVAAGQSFICTDTKGDLFRTYRSVCEKFGYQVFVFNTKGNGWLMSDSWNCLKEIVDADDITAWSLINKFAECFINNTGSSKEKKDYWTNNEQDLLRACLHYICRSPSYRGERNFEGLMAFANSGLEEIDATFKALKETDSAYVASASFRNQGETKLKDSYLSGLTNKLSIFRHPVIQAVLSYDGIDFNEHLTEKTAIFLITDDSDGTYDMISSLFVTFAYIKLMEIADSPSHKGKMKRPFWFLLDELCNMAAIEDFSRKIATNRSRNVHIMFAIQSFSQLLERYRELWVNIMANAGTVIFFGCTDDDTAKWIAERCGKVKLADESETRDSPALSPRFTQAFTRKTRTMTKEEYLLSPYQARSLGKRCIVCIGGKPAFWGEPYGADRHPLYRFAEEDDQIRTPAWNAKFGKDHKGMKLPAPVDYEVSDFEKSEQIMHYSPPEKEPELDNSGAQSLARSLLAKEEINEEEFYADL